jgi:hypothetical protein
MNNQRILSLCGVLLAAGALFSPVCSAQKEVSTRSQELAQIHSEQWIDRSEGYEKLKADTQALKSSTVQLELLNLLDRENRLTESTLRDSAEKIGVSDGFGEEYSEYVAALGETVDSFADWTDAHQVCIFVHESYDPESRFAAKIAAHSAIALPCLIDMYRSDLGLDRAQAAPLIVQVLAKSEVGSLSQNLILQGKESVSKALQDPSEAVRINTIEALRKFAGTDMIPALRQVVETDPAPEVNGKSIRRWAAEAIVAIEKRAGH